MSIPRAIVPDWQAFEAGYGESHLDLQDSRCLALQERYMAEDGAPDLDMRGPLHGRRVRCLVTTEAGEMREMDWDATDGRKPKWRWRGGLSPWRVVAWRPMPASDDDIEQRLRAAEQRLAEYRAAVARVLEEVAGAGRPLDPDSYLPPPLVDCLRQVR